MKRLHSLFLTFALLPCFLAACCESVDMYADARFPTIDDYALFGGVWYVYEIEMYGVTVSGSDLGSDGYLLLNADGTALSYNGVGTVDQMIIQADSIDLLWRVSADGAIAYPSESFWEKALALQNIPEDWDEDTINELKAQLRTMLVFRMKVNEGVLTLRIELNGIRVPSYENYTIRFRHHLPEETQPLPAIRSAADAGEFYGAWIWDTLVLNEKQRLPISSLIDAAFGSTESTQSGSVTIDECGISGSIVNGRLDNLQFSDGQLSCSLDLQTGSLSYQPSIKMVSNLLAWHQSVIGSSYDIDLTVSLCENGSIRIRYEGTGWQNTVDIYFVRETAMTD